VSKIGINLLYINPKLAGGSVTYALKLVKEISLLDQKNKYVIYINKECKDINFEVGNNFEIRVLNFKYSSVYLRYFWEQIILPFYIFKDKIDLLHSLGYVTPLFTNAKKVVSILDINYKGHSNNMSPSKRFLLGSMVNLSAIFSNKIITISEFSKEQIVKYTKVKRDKIIVTLLSGSTDSYLDENTKTNSFLQKYKIDTDYIIAFSSTSLHKNLERLIVAAQGILNEKSNLKLVLVGHQNRSQNIINCIKKFELIDKVIFTGFVPDEDINPLLSNAKIFAFPSLYEGFGIPLLDAQACKVPVISSNAGSLPEVGGKELVYFNPYSINEIKNAISYILDDDSITEYIVKKGLENRSKFSWNNTAQQTLDVYSKVLNKI
jgi:glycosyltransferase involved in cell wall biosynthesis